MQARTGVAGAGDPPIPNRRWRKVDCLGSEFVACRAIGEVQDPDLGESAAKLCLQPVFTVKCRDAATGWASEGYVLDAFKGSIERGRAGTP
jgi:hypothetical protein